MDRLREILVPREAWHPYPTRDERKAWESIPQDIRQAYIARGDTCLGFDWQPFRATLFLEMAKSSTGSGRCAKSRGGGNRGICLIKERVPTSQIFQKRVSTYLSPRRRACSLGRVICSLPRSMPSLH